MMRGWGRGEGVKKISPKVSHSEYAPSRSVSCGLTFSSKTVPLLLCNVKVVCYVPHTVKHA